MNAEDREKKLREILGMNYMTVDPNVVKHVILFVEQEIALIAENIYGPSILSTLTDVANKAKREAYEEAANIAEAEIETWDKVGEFERVKQCQIIAECIRARAKEGGVEWTSK